MLGLQPGRQDGQEGQVGAEINKQRSRGTGPPGVGDDAWISAAAHTVPAVVLSTLSCSMALTELTC